MPPWWQLTQQQRARHRAGIVRIVRAGKPVSGAAARYGVTVRTAYLACKAQSPGGPPENEQPREVPGAWEF